MEGVSEITDVCRQTADTFLAAAAFLELLNIWGQMDPEIASKIKYAKYHAVRIARAIKSGEDPNSSNPVPDASIETDQVLDRSTSSKEQSLKDGTASQPRESRQPSVEEVPDEHDRVQRSLAQRSSLDESLHPSRASSVPPLGQAPTTFSYPAPEASDERKPEADVPSVSEVSPLQPPSEQPGVAADDGYFPRLGGPSSTVSSSQQPPVLAQDLQRPFAAPSSDASARNHHPSAPDMESQEARSFYKQTQPPVASYLPNQLTNDPHGHNTQQQTHSSMSHHQHSGRPVMSETLRTDDEAMTKAQKHARWAISALNFEDVKTAVKELRNALDSLGAQ